MKLYINITRAVIQALEMIFEGNKYADKVIEKVLKQNPKWGARDRRFIAETTYDIVRWQRLLQNITEADANDYWKLLGGWCVLHDIPLPAWVEFSGLSEKKIFERLDKMNAIRRFRESIPDWLDTLGEDQLGDRWDEELHALNKEAHVILRANTLKISTGDLQQYLKETGIENTALQEFPHALVLKERQNVFRHPAFKDGLFEVQDAASQLIAPFMRVEPGMRVVDACAGAGGKTLHIAALMKNKGRIIGLDVEQWKLEELRKRARRAGVGNLETRIIESSKTIKRLENSADRLLLDVPCSGLGVLKRNPDAKWKLSPEFITQVKELQQHILQDYGNILKKGGLMVYSTCSILPAENEQQIEVFLSKNKDGFEFVEERYSWPSAGFDGFYMALIRKK
ncbi:MAG: RsmB/NOP family class I SAM-dependent RNA methyltransferase [Cyclobacteriaceae bacterium]|jgi:16S rRNA (cytosine967-C5)-methyltransferase|nr:RsmB/NOP family class I SAM-dependent RNA methyltransferase [Cyclobacteriaceae bacterium]MDH4296324.1 RsmB/NOP family class I SAM-dependent RNA methyltransferase [Cyclobacteriaceae bacterium]MDH5249536.1 RsmB/NOP family class I SAM-dependent RNA methyltransferase [Cyclobacteriaceae bacterium]